MTWNSSAQLICLQYYLTLHHLTVDNIKDVTGKEAWNNCVIQRIICVIQRLLRGRPKRASSQGRGKKWNRLVFRACCLVGSWGPAVNFLFWGKNSFCILLSGTICGVCGETADRLRLQCATAWLRTALIYFTVRWDRLSWFLVTSSGI